MPLIIKKPKLEDIDKIQKITEEAYRYSYKENFLVTEFKELPDLDKKYETGEVGILIANLENDCIGAVRYRFSKNGSLYFFKLAVTKNYRRQGVAAALLAALEKEVRAKNCFRIELDCALEKHLPDFYKKLGYKIDTIVEHGNHHDVHMSKVLVKQDFK